MSLYEVWCPHCSVTFPPKTKVCLHCGGRTSPDRPHGSFVGLWETPVLDMVEAAPPGTTHSAEDGTIVQEGSGRRSLMRAGMSVIWMVVLAAGYTWRACSGS